MKDLEVRLQVEVEIDREHGARDKELRAGRLAPRRRAIQFDGISRQAASSSQVVDGNVAPTFVEVRRRAIGVDLEHLEWTVPLEQIVPNSVWGTSAGSTSTPWLG